MSDKRLMCNGLKRKAFESLAVGSEYIPVEEPNPINVPIYSSSTFKISSVDHGEDLATGKSGWIYSRWENPTTEAASNTLNNLEGGYGTLLFSSGMAAITTALMALLKSGDHVVMPNMVYAGTLSLVRNILSRFGVEFTSVDGTDPEKYREAVKPSTKVLFCESPCNPTMTLMDFEEFGKLGKTLGIVTMTDGTFASPFNQTPIQHGIDVVIHSCTKYIGGHSDITAGSLTLASKQLFHQCYELRKFLGGCLSPFDASLLHRGLKTLHVRMERHNYNAMEIAKFLEAHPKVEKVHYPGLQSHPHHEVAKKQMRGFSGMVSFEVKGGRQGASRLVEHVELIQLAVSLGGVQSLIEVPGAMTHPEKYITASDRQEGGLRESLIRFSVGLENVEDLKKDLEQALEKV
ncbi:cystathionine gamma-synthase-like [Montipora capricornis]|uniref:cystathionine gamma-synthase-like n=1 Tax=Montipora capricornis TaxID=246305 RepID=UPI0035F2188D